jgi:hypothetical protein
VSDDPPRPGDELCELAWFALQHGVASVEEGGPLVPLVIAETQEGRTLQRFVAMADEDELDLDASIAQARQHVLTESDASRAALAYDGYVTAEGARFDAILVQAQERGSPTAFTFAQRYQQDRSGTGFAPIGDAMFLGPAEPILE